MKTEKMKVLLYLKKSGKDKQGKAPIMGRITLGRSIAQFSCKLSCDIDLWSPRESRMRGKSHEAVEVNGKLDSLVLSIQSTYQTLLSKGQTFTATDIKEQFQGSVQSRCMLIEDGSDPIGKVIRFGTIPFRVIGVMKKKGYNTMGMDQDDYVLAPYTSVMKRILAQDYLSQIIASAVTEGVTEQATSEMTSILRRTHKLKEATDNTEGDEDDFNIRSQEELSSMMNSTTNMLTILLGCVAGISLIVGGIGIMNIMYVSVTERTREIGLRMSVGARGIDILNQFLIESILLSVTGGIIGVIVGVSGAYAVKIFAHWPIEIQPWTIVMSFAVCTFTGVFFGWYPAKKAVQLDPIEAIRYE